MQTHKWAGLQLEDLLGVISGGRVVGRKPAGVTCMELVQVRGVFELGDGMLELSVACCCVLAWGRCAWVK